MSTTKTICAEVEVDVSLSDFDTDDLIEELESREAGKAKDFRLFDFERLFTLRLCGQKDVADREALEALWSFIDRGEAL